MIIETNEFITGLLSFVLVITVVYIGLFIASRYRKSNNKVFIFAGVACSGLFDGWYPSAVNFLLIVFTGQSLSQEAFFLIGNLPLGFQMLSWVFAVTELTYKERQKLMLSFYGIISIVFYIAFFYYIFTDSSVIGVLLSPVDVQYKGFTLLYILFCFASVVIFGLLLAKELLKSEEKESRLKAKFLIYTFLVWAFFGALDAAISLEIILLIIVRFILLSTAFTFYCGWFLPESIKRIFIKGN